MKVVIAVVLGVLGVALFAGLGTWQIKRMHWKEELNAKIAAYQDEDVRLDGYLEDDAAAFRRGFVDGWWDGARTFKTKPRLQDGKIGYWIITPLVLPSRKEIMVNRGWVADGEEEAALAVRVPRGRVRVRGVLREHGALADYEQVRTGGQWVLFLQDSEPKGSKLLTPAPVQASLRNEHKNYAIFWFVMAALLAGLGGFSLLKRRSA